MNKLKPSTQRVLFVLFSLCILSAIFYLTPFGRPATSFALALRSKKLLAYLLISIASSFATISFQTITENRFLTPSILGMESFYVLIQTLYLFFTNRFIGTTTSPLFEFLIVLLMQGVFFFFLQPALQRLLKQSFVFILLICMALGTLFKSLSTFLQVLMDPNEYDQLQGKLFPSFQRINHSILLLATLLIICGAFYLFRKNAILNIFHLDKSTATLLGVDVKKEQTVILWAIVLLVSITTALVGPLMFLGFILSNLTYFLIKEYQHKWLFITASLLGFFTLTIGQLIVERIFQLQITVTMIIEFAGGLFFFYLLYKNARRSTCT